MKDEVALGAGPCRQGLCMSFSWGWDVGLTGSTQTRQWECQVQELNFLRLPAGEGHLKAEAFSTLQFLFPKLTLSKS